MDYNFDENLYVTQIIPTIQGEGYLTGVPSLLIRLGGCNCRCKFCDTKFTWNFDFDSENSQIINKDSFQKFMKLVWTYKDEHKLTNLMITGGEPTLYHDNSLFYKLLNDNMFETIEIETNGTKINKINKQNISSNTFFNISPKLDPNIYVDREDFNNLLYNIKEFLNDIPNNVNLKLIDSESFRDINENFINIINKDFLLKRTNIQFMTLTPSRKDFRNYNDFIHEVILREKKTLKYCMLNGYKFSSRLHLYMFFDENETI